MSNDVAVVGLCPLLTVMYADEGLCPMLTVMYADVGLCLMMWLL